jgi:hypothetical protein
MKALEFKTKEKEFIITSKIKTCTGYIEDYSFSFKLQKDCQDRKLLKYMQEKNRRFIKRLFYALFTDKEESYKR